MITDQLGQIGATIIINNDISCKFNRNFTFNCRFKLNGNQLKSNLVLIGFLSWKFSVQPVMSDHVNSTGTS